MKYAFCVMAHCDIDELNRLVNTLRSYGDIFLHVDKKMKDANYMKRVQQFVADNKEGAGKVYLTDRRIAVYWGGFSLVRCHQVMLEKCVQTGVYDRIFILSGLCYPLWGPKKFDKFFSDHRTEEFVSALNVTTCDNPAHLHKVVLYRPFRDIELPEGFFRRCITAGSKLILKYLGFRKHPYIQYKNGEKWDIYWGGAWPGLTYECAQFVLDQLHHNKALVRYFSTSVTPDELLIPTIIFNSKYASRAQFFDTKEDCLPLVTPLHYIDYSCGILSYDEHDFDMLMNSGKVFVRKLRSGKSERLIEMIHQSYDAE
jgi:hypothetical protein